MAKTKDGGPRKGPRAGSVSTREIIERAKHAENMAKTTINNDGFSECESNAWWRLCRIYRYLAHRRYREKKSNDWDLLRKTKEQ